jgi:hypothetical protein
VATVSRALLLIGLVAAPLAAEVVRIEVRSRADVVNGRTFGTAGLYKNIAGETFFAVDPTLPANRIVTDIEGAPERQREGRVLVLFLPHQAKTDRAHLRSRRLRSSVSRGLPGSIS